MVRFKSAATVSLVALAALSLASCEKAAEPAATAPAQPAKLPVSINATMVSLVDHASDYLFALSNGDMPRNDRDWDLVRASAYETMLAGAVIQMQGTGGNDAAWVADPQWQEMSGKLTVIGEEALKLADAKSTDREAWSKIGGDLVDDCQACHQKFKPEIPSEGILHGSTERESRGISIFD